MVRATLFADTCSELALFVNIDWELKRVIDLGRIMVVCAKENDAERWYQAREAMDQLKVCLRLNGQALKSRFGVRMWSRGYDFTEDFVKWLAWWRLWMADQTPNDIIQMKTALDSNTGELSPEDEKRFRPEGSWECVV